VTATSSTPARGTRLPRSARRRQLLGAALEVFVANGYHAAAMDDIAERAGVSKPVLYQHFPGKQELYLALLDQHTGTLEQRVRTALESTTDNRERVSRCIRAYFDFVDDPDGAYRLVFESDLRNDPEVRERVERSLRLSVEALADTIARDTGLVRDEAELLSCGLAGLAEVSSRWWLTARGSGSGVSEGSVPTARVSKDRAIELLEGLCWRGIGGYPLTAATAPSSLPATP
jgi:AcrR family transcriptional regulator